MGWHITQTQRAAGNGIIALAMLAAAFVFEYWGKLPPCTLCWYQRYVYAAIVVLALLSWRLIPHQASRWLFTALYATGFAIASFHVGVEQGWWTWESTCSGGVKALSVDSLRAELLGRAPVRCDEIPWSFTGLSMAAWNAILSLCLMLLNALLRPTLRQGLQPAS